MKWFFGGIIIISTIFAILTGRISALSNIVLNEGANAVKLTLAIAGSICWWSGMMKIVEKTGFNSTLSKIIYPITKRIFTGINKNSIAVKTISMNISANLLGLGNAATPLGIKAMGELAKEEKTNGVASNNMVMLVVLNTASIQLIPTTIAMLRAKAGAKAPLDILPLILLASVVSVCVGLTLAKLIGKSGKRV
jgi:spore maturation protein A